MKNKKSICVFAGASDNVDSVFVNAARSLGNMCAIRHIEVRCGGGNTGLMAALIDGVLEKEGYVKGILPQFMIDNGWHHLQLSELVATPTMHSRKQMMSDATMAVVALPGGIGTFEELFEIITWRQLGLYSGKVIVLNIAGYYDSFVAMLENAVSAGFMKDRDMNLFPVVASVDAVMEILSDL